MPLVVVKREVERERLFQETAEIRARLAREEEDERTRLLLDEGGALLEAAERIRLGSVLDSADL